MSIDWNQVTKRYFDDLPHPHGHGLKIGEYATAVKLASLIKFGGHASGAEARMFYDEFQATGMSPQEFEHVVDRVAPLSYTYHGRPPTMHELTQLKDKASAEVRRYFADLPDQHYPHVTAGEMVKAMQSAAPHAWEFLGRAANKMEAAYLHHSGERPAEYYERIAAKDGMNRATIPPDSNVVSPSFGGNLGGRSSRDFGRSSPDQRITSG